MNNQKDIISFILLSNSGLSCQIFRVNENKKINLIGQSISSPEGINNGIIVNVKLASKSIRHCISVAEKQAKINLSLIHILFEPKDLLLTRVSKYKKLGGSKIHTEDISFLINEAKNQILSNDMKKNILHTYNFNYVVDNIKFLSEPINIYSDFFFHELSFLTLPKNIFKNMTQVFDNCEITIGRFIFNPFALGVELLSNDEINNGCLIVNFDNQQTTLTIFKDASIIFYKSIPVTIGHIIMDLSKGCSLTLEESQQIIKNYGIMKATNFKKGKENKQSYLNKKFFIETKYRKISENLIFDIISARAEEIIEFLRKNIVSSGVNLGDLKKIYFYGSTYNIDDIHELLTNSFDLLTENIVSYMDATFCWFFKNFAGRS